MDVGHVGNGFQLKPGLGCSECKSPTHLIIRQTCRMFTNDQEHSEETFATKVTGVSGGIAVTLMHTPGGRWTGR